MVLGAPADAITSLTHLLLRVDLPEGPYLADAGFGHITPTAPLMLKLDEEQPTLHETYRLRSINGETLLQVRRKSDWQNVYRFSDRPTYPIDHEVGNWFTSTRPNDLFTDNLVAARPAPQCRKTLFNGAVTIRNLGSGTDRSVLQSETALRNSLQEHFGIDLDGPETATIHAAMRRFINRPDPGFALD